MRDAAFERRTTRRAPWLALGLLALGVATVAAYGPALEGEFQWDDLAAVADNPAIRDLGLFLRSVPSRISPASRLTTDLTFAIDYRRAGLDPGAFHRTSLLIHLATAALLFLLGRALLRRAGWSDGAGIALAATALWALHPLQSQAVSYVVQRAEALAALLAALSLLFLLAALRRGRTAGGLLLLLAATAAFALGLQAKLSAVALPALWLLVALCFPERAVERAAAPRPLRPLAATVPLLLVAGPVALAALGAFRGRPDIGFAMARAPQGSYPLTQLRAVAHYLRLLFWPTGQCLDPDFTWSRSLFDPPATLLAGLLLLALAVGAVWLLRRAARSGAAPDAARTARAAAFGVGWFFVALAPSSSLVPVIDAAEEHRPYLAAWGIAFAAAAAGSLLLKRLLPERRTRIAATALTALLCAALAVALHRRNQVWRTQVSLWSDVVEKWPLRARARYNLGFGLASAGDHEGAVREYLVASRLLENDHLVSLPGLLRNLGASLIELGRIDEALGHLLQAQALDPGSPDIVNNLALGHLLKGDLARAEELARAAIALPGGASLGSAHNTLGEVLGTRGDLAGALAAFRRAAELMPDHPGILANVALAQERLGLPAEACATWARVGGLRGGAQRLASEQHRAALGCAPAR